MTDQEVYEIYYKYFEETIRDYPGVDIQDLMMCTQNLVPVGVDDQWAVGVLWDVVADKGYRYTADCTFHKE